MSILIGRLALAEPKSLRMGVDGSVAMTGKVDAADFNLNQFRALSLLSLLDGATDGAEPFIWTENYGIAGYYRIRGGDVTPRGSLEAGYEWTLDLERLSGGWQLPGIESVLLGGFRTNTISYAASSTQPWHALPVEAVEISSSQSDDAYSVDGSFLTWRSWDYGAEQREVVRWAIPAFHFYDDAATIQIKVGDAWETVVGDQALVQGPQSLGGISLPDPPEGAIDRIRICSGGFGVSFNQAGQLYMYRNASANAADWGDPVGGTWQLGEWDGAFQGAFTIYTVSILRNRPEEVRVRLSARSAPFSSAAGPFHEFDVSLRRGDAQITVAMKKVGGANQFRPAIKFDTTAMASTAITTGLRRTTFDPVDFTQQAVVCSRQTTKDTGNGTLYATNAVNPGFVVPFGLSLQWDSSITEQAWFAPYTEIQRIVGR